MTDTPAESSMTLRQRAEEKLRTSEGVPAKAYSPEETERLIHELRVHQIELEMQNEDMRRAQHDLEMVKNRYFDLYDLAPVAYLTLNEQGLIQEANLTAATLFGMTLKNMLKKPLTSFVLPEDQNMYYLHRKRVVEESDARGCELRMLRADGSLFWAYKHATPMQGGEYLVTLTDITKLKQMEEELRRAKVAAEAASIAKSQFLAVMSHEIRTPMNSIVGAIQLLEMSDLQPDQREDLDYAKMAGLDLVRLINDILELSKIEADKIDLEIADIDVRKVIADAIKMLSPEACEKHVALTSEVAPDVPAVLKGDAGRLRQIIINLVSNAIKFTSAGFVALQVRKEIESEHATTLHFQVCDSGIGIAADKQELIFEPFTQADSSTTRKYGGTGLGLTICKRLVGLMGGSIGVESAEGEGSTFWFTVVLAKRSVGGLLPGAGGEIH